MFVYEYTYETKIFIFIYFLFIWKKIILSSCTKYDRINTSGISNQPNCTTREQSRIVRVTERIYNIATCLYFVFKFVFYVRLSLNVNLWKRFVKFKNELLICEIFNWNKWTNICDNYLWINGIKLIVKIIPDIIVDFKALCKEELLTF